MVSFLNERSKRESFSCAPVDSFTCLNRLQSIVEDLGNRGMEFFSLWESGNLFSNTLQLYQVNSGIFYKSILSWLFDLLPCRISPVLYSIFGNLTI